MGDSKHLERMGSELKCPICLSLLNSAVSLNCNHVFCNSCIVKSMKSDSNCPVCKVPFRRREVRPAPHMDSLVSIYKSMEIASGINIFVTQNAPSTKFSDGKQQPEDCDNQAGHDFGVIFSERAEEQNVTRRNETRETCNPNLKGPGSASVKPSFPTKKRVQVPQCPLSATTRQHVQFEGEIVENTENLSKECSLNVKDPDIKDKGEPVLSPFFWLREEESVERLSQDDDVDELTNTPLPNPPSFSDMKDSDDDTCDGFSPQGEKRGKSTSVADLLDSEMFEWTQRPCSPELSSSPFKTVVTNAEFGGVHEKDRKEASQHKKTRKEVPAENAIYKKSKPDDGSTVVLHDISNPGTKNSNNQAVNHNSKKRGWKVRETTGNADAMKDTGPASIINVDSINGSKKSSLKLSKTRKRSKNSHPYTVAANPTSENTMVSVPDGTVDQCCENLITELPSPQGNDENSNENFIGKKTRKCCQKSHVQDQIQHPVRAKNQSPHLLDSIQNVFGEVSNIPNQKNEGGLRLLSLLSVPTADSGKAVDPKDKPSIRSRRFSSCDLESKKSSRVSSDGNSKNNMGNEMQASQVTHMNNLQAKETHANTIQDSPNARVLVAPALVKKLPSLTNDAVLQRCETTLGKNQCAFCFSSEESEATGEIVHYFNGRPIAADHNRGQKVIHSHKNCTEWAPNVYFKDDIAMNLEVELTRSRRIKCCCCGVKGAALGCFEKSCRKSFHVPCAKLIPECRWDTDNFVMLCPLHASSKLPSEYSESQRRKTCSAKKQSHVQKSTVSIKHDCGTSTRWSSYGSSKKLVLCCSALTESEREVIFRFEKIAGVAVLKKWDSTVTHVIASTDENGACRRTLKVLMGILEGKWILRMEWIKACMEANKLVDEERYEISIDTHGVSDGPRHGRLRLLNKQPKLFNGFKFYLMGDFLQSYKGYLQDLITAAGGIILHRKPVSKDQNAVLSGSPTCQTVIVYSLELPQKCDPSKQDMIFNCRRVDAESLASSTGAKAASNLCILNAIAACKLQILTE